jgi:hypothetical protein
MQREKVATGVAPGLLKESRIATGNGPGAVAEMKSLSTYQKREVVLCLVCAADRRTIEATVGESIRIG